MQLGVNKLYHKQDFYNLKNIGDFVYSCVLGHVFPLISCFTKYLTSGNLLESQGEPVPDPDVTFYGSDHLCCDPTSRMELRKQQLIAFFKF